MIANPASVVSPTDHWAWSSDNFLRVDYSKKCMSLNRFFAIWSHLHVVDNSVLSTEGLSRKFKPIKLFVL